jgi:hypothetical protein
MGIFFIAPCKTAQPLPTPATTRRPNSNRENKRQLIGALVVMFCDTVASLILPIASIYIEHGTQGYMGRQADLHIYCIKRDVPPNLVQTQKGTATIARTPHFPTK